MHLIRHSLDSSQPTPAPYTIVPLHVDRRKLAKRRWRGAAQDGTQFGFDLEQPLSHHDAFFARDGKVYRIEQQAETVLKIPFQTPSQAARYGWMVGNMHFPASFAEDALLAEDDSAVRQMLERNHIDYSFAKLVFRPVLVASGHHHH